MTLGLCPSKDARTQHQRTLLVPSQLQMLKSTVAPAKIAHLPQSLHPQHRGKEKTVLTSSRREQIDPQAPTFVHDTRTTRVLMK